MSLWFRLLPFNHALHLLTERGANGRQPFGSDHIRKSLATASRGSRFSLGVSMRMSLTLVYLFSIAVFGKAAEVPSGSQGRPVWYWQARGNAQRIKLEVRLDEKTIFTTTLSIAHTGRSAIPKRSYAKKIRFSFKPERSIVWSGYRDEDVVSPAKQRIECDIWMAGADANAVILGVSFGRSDAILMNTLHLASPTSEARSVLADGLVVITCPVSEKKPNQTIQATAATPRS